MRGRASGRASSRGVGLRRGVRGQSAGTSRTHVIHKGRRGDAAHDRPGAHDGCGVRELSPIMLAAREGSSELRRRRSRRRQRAESAVVGRGRERRRRHYGQRRRHRRMCRGRHGDDPVQESSSHRSQTTSTFGRQISSQQRPHTAPKQLVLDTLLSKVQEPVSALVQTHEIAKFSARHRQCGCRAGAQFIKDLQQQVRG